MIKTHQLIRAKLENFSTDVQALAIRALELAESMPERSVFEQLKGIARQITKEKGESIDSQEDKA